MEQTRWKFGYRMRTQRVDSSSFNALLREALSRWQEEVVQLDLVDPVTTEMVRLRCAEHHDCHT